MIRTSAAAEIKGSSGVPPVPGSVLAEAEALGLIMAEAEALGLDMALAEDEALVVADDEALDMADDEALDIISEFFIICPLGIMCIPLICCASAAGAKTSAASATITAR